MQNKEIEKILDCSECKFATCEQCEISYTEKTKIKKYIEDIEQKNKLLSNTTNELIHLHNVTPNSVIIEKKEKAIKKYNKIHSQHYRDCGIAENREKAKIVEKI